MGMDVYGKKPANETGKYFRNNIWYWRPLADYIEAVTPEALFHQCQHWQTNDGDGLNEKGALQLADILEGEIASGRCAEYAMRRQAMLDKLPRQNCRWCLATGTRRDAVGREMGMVERKWCNGCDGKGWTEHPDSSYPFDIDNVREFIAFLRACGGFEIN